MPILAVIPRSANVACARRLTYADSRMKNLLSCLHGHSGVCERVLAIQGGRGRLMESNSDPHTVLLRLPWTARAVDSRAATSKCTRREVRGRNRGQQGPCGRVERRARLTRRRSVGLQACWARRLRVRSGPSGSRLRCRSSSRPASVLETRSVEARGCIRGRRTPVGGRSRCSRAGGGRATDVFRERQHASIIEFENFSSVNASTRRRAPVAINSSARHRRNR